MSNFSSNDPNLTFTHDASFSTTINFNKKKYFNSQKNIKKRKKTKLAPFFTTFPYFFYQQNRKFTFFYDQSTNQTKRVSTTW